MAIDPPNFWVAKGLGSLSGSFDFVVLNNLNLVVFPTISDQTVVLSDMEGIGDIWQQYDFGPVRKERTTSNFVVTKLNDWIPIIWPYEISWRQKVSGYLNE